MMDYEKLGAFYLGKAYDLENKQRRDDVVLYDSKDLTTHAAIIGMTGSGKTGLGIGMLEEAAIDKIPVIAVDPKGDLGNLLLTFPKLRPQDFEPWVNSRSASDKGMTTAEYAEAQSSLWREGLKDWGQGADRIKKLRDTVDLSIYTPGSNSGLPISVLRSFNAPSATVMEDLDVYRERVQATATGILALLGIDADPITSREHILIANILDRSWQEGGSLDLGGLIAAIQDPPIKRIGVMDLDSFYPAKDRLQLAMRMNNLLAAPGFEAWMEGEPLDVGKLLHTESGKPRVSVISIAHLTEAERMFFVTMLLNELIGWMRSQSGTSTLRAILYMDEVFGYLPPIANPPSKPLFLTLLKQARAYGVGLVLATQNPVDLDYKALSNTGTWFIGRLQTERDKARVMEGLEGAAAGGNFDKQRMEQIIAGLGKRRFLLHNVHEDEPVVFNTRWVMSYLAGPFTRNQIRKLMKGRKPAPATSAPEPGKKDVRAATKAVKVKRPQEPVLPASVKQYFMPVGAHSPGDKDLVYVSKVGAGAEIAYSSSRYNVNEEREVFLIADVDDGPVPVDWDDSAEIEFDIGNLESDGEQGAIFTEPADAAAEPKNYKKWERLFKTWLRTNKPLKLYKSKTYKLVSEPGETEGNFRVRLQELANEKRDLAIEKLRDKYASKVATREERLRKAEQVIEREQQQAKSKKLDTAISFGTAVLGSLLGRKKVSRTSASRMGTAIKSIGRMGKEKGDIKRARETAEAVRAQLEELNEQMEQDIEELEDRFDAQDEELTEIQVKATATNITVHFVALTWMPHYRDAAGRLHPAYG
ncbi:MAG: DUF87 domain-containing protein [Gammaproteobacteria bacterium]|nr:DUF87 domain-containing protein [Gammaproteobacteria bacterium]NNM20871.1 DUF87 domain-containing protein [Gammaproteobacteria bacterium]